MKISASVTPPPPSFQTIPIVVAFDNNYCIPAGVSLYSMLSSCAQERDGVKLFYQIHCLVDSLSTENNHGISFFFKIPLDLTSVL